MRRKRKEELLPAVPHLYQEETLFEKIRAFISGVKYIVILTIMLWWIPILGQAMAGYVGGRRSGSPYRGFLAAMTPVFAIMAISKLYYGEWVPSASPFSPLFGSVASAITPVLPFVIPYLNFSTLYLADVTESLRDVAALQISAYTIVIVFAFIGGLMADQNKREIKNAIEKALPSQIPALTQPVQQIVWTVYGGEPKKVVRFEDLKPLPATAYGTSASEEKPASTEVEQKTRTTYRTQKVASGTRKTARTSGRTKKGTGGRRKGKKHAQPLGLPVVK